VIIIINSEISQVLDLFAATNVVQIIPHLSNRISFDIKHFSALKFLGCISNLPENVTDFLYLISLGVLDCIHFLHKPLVTMLLFLKAVIINVYHQVTFLIMTVTNK
jgi:hypothetical protein